MEWTKEQILALRLSLRLSRRAFAKKLGISRVMVWYWESGKKVPSKDSQA
jgi:DNA-binding transcriptional regulator YiaG